MCQVTPFTLPCCRRIYVTAQRLPSCPTDWPRKKCPKELCVQISGFEPGDVLQKASGICWRCDADRQAKGAWEREEMRPVLDKAFVVEGLEEFTLDERRRRTEKGGLCWFCGAREGCATCGTVGSHERALTGFKKDRFEGGVDKGQKRMVEANMGRAKRLKTESGRAVPAATMLANPYSEPQVLDPLLQQIQQHMDPEFSRSGLEYEQINQTAPNFSYQIQDVHFQPAEPQYASGLGYEQFSQPAPAFNYQGQDSQFENIEPRNALPDWQVPRDFQLPDMFGQGDGGVQVLLDPLLEQLQGGEQAQRQFELPLHLNEEYPPVPNFGFQGGELVQQSFTLPLSQGPEFPEIPDFGAELVDLTPNDFDFGVMDDESFTKLLEGYNDLDMFKIEDDVKEPTTETPKTSQLDTTAAPAQQPATRTSQISYADQLAVPTQHPNIVVLPF